MREYGNACVSTANLRCSFITGSSWPEHQRLALPLWFHTYDQYRAGGKDDMMPSIIRTPVEFRREFGNVVFFDTTGWIGCSEQDTHDSGCNNQGCNKHLTEHKLPEDYQKSSPIIEADCFADFLDLRIFSRLHRDVEALVARTCHSACVTDLSIYSRSCMEKVLHFQFSPFLENYRKKYMADPVTKSTMQQLRIQLARPSCGHRTYSNRFACLQSSKC